MPNSKEVIQDLELVYEYIRKEVHDIASRKCRMLDKVNDALTLLKELENEYENGFNDAMLGKQELMYESTDGKWHKKDW